jgi:hypothetical protein
MHIHSLQHEVVSSVRDGVTELLEVVLSRSSSYQWWTDRTRAALERLMQTEREVAGNVSHI